MATQFKLLHPGDISPALWQDFAAVRNLSTRYDSPFFDPDFARLVSEVREDTRMGIVEDSGALVGYWPLHARSGGWARPIGGPFSDWHAPILHPDMHISPDSFLRGLGLTGFTGFGFKSRPQDGHARLSRSGANLAILNTDWQDYINTQQEYWPKHFKKMRRVYRKAKQDFSQLQFIWDDRSVLHFDRLMTMKRTQYKSTGLHDVLKADWARKLIDRLRHFEGPRLRSRQSTLLFDGEFVASEFNLQSDRVLHGWLVGFDYKFSAYSPGHMLVQEMLQAMCPDGLKIYDMGPGEERHKRHYTNMQTAMDIGVITGRSAPFSPIRTFGKLWRGGEKHLPARMAENMARLRRRTDQIMLAETEYDARLAGLGYAFQKRAFKSTH